MYLVHLSLSTEKGLTIGSEDATVVLYGRNILITVGYEFINIQYVDADPQNTLIP